MRRFLNLMMMVFCVGVMSACTMVEPSAQLKGEVAYRVRMALPPQAVLEVSINDVSLQDVSAKVIAKKTIKLDGKQVPIPFVLSYDPARVDARNTYSMSARITVDGQLWFTSTEHIPVTLDGADQEPVVVWVDRVSGQ